MGDYTSTRLRKPQRTHKESQEDINNKSDVGDVKMSSFFQPWFVVLEEHQDPNNVSFSVTAKNKRKLYAGLSSSLLSVSMGMTLWRQQTDTEWVHRKLARSHHKVTNNLIPQ